MSKGEQMKPDATAFTGIEFEKIEEEFGLLMSLSLDGLLDDEEQRRFERYLSTYPSLADTWVAWQSMDMQLQAEPAVAPPPDFLLNFEMRLAQRERRRNLGWGIAFGVAAVLLWVAAMAGLASLGAFVLLSQSDWLTRLVHNVAQLSVGLRNWMMASGAALSTVASTNEARTFVLVYALVSAALLTAWVFFLRHSTRNAAVTVPA